MKGAKLMLPRIARLLWNIAKWFWPAVIVAFVVTYAGNIAPLPLDSFVKTFSGSVLGALFLPGLHLILTLCVATLLVVLTFIAWRYKEVDEAPAPAATKSNTNVVRNSRSVTAQAQDSSSSIVFMGEVHAPVTIGQHLPSPQSPVSASVSSSEVLQHYFNDLISKHRSLIPTGIANPASQSLLSVSVPLDEVFIHLAAAADRPLFALAMKRSKIEEAILVLRERHDLSLQDKEEQIQSLRAALWQSELGRDMLGGRQENTITIETVLQRLSSEKPVAVLLGSPGAGKSTTMRWLALQMARACNKAAALSQELAPVQIPVLVRIDDYAKLLSDYAGQPAKQPGQQPTFQKFFADRLDSIEPGLADLLHEELRQGHCLLLFDGLDEVATDDVRLRVRDDIYDFIRLCRDRQRGDEAFNRFLVTSRIVGYEPGAFTQFDEYTLDDLSEKQIEQFLTRWCPAVERYQAGKNVPKLTAQDERSCAEEGRRQKDRLWRAIQDTPGIKRMAVNPLMLTILALIQKTGGKLPHRRIDLYESVALTLLDNWNQTRGGQRFAPEDIRVAEEVLSALAYERHSRDLLLTQQRTLEITRETIAGALQRSTDDIDMKYVQKFIETLSAGSGLFGQRGQGLFDFIHRTFEEYYAAMYLVNQRYKSTQELQAFVTRQYYRSTWHEPILLAVAYLSAQKDRRLRDQANELIQALLDTHTEDDALLQRNLLLATECVVDCDYLAIQSTHQQRIANALLDLYGDVLGAGRYTKLQQDIERVMLMWLRGQPKESSFPPPLLETLCAALCASGDRQRQEGAAHLAASLAPDLPACPASVLPALLPPLLQLADVLDIPGIPPEIQARLPEPAAKPASPNVADYALIALQLLDAAGPAGWLHQQWLTWDKDQPELLTLLSRHSLELDFLLTPAALSRTSNQQQRKAMIKLVEEWQQRAQRDPHDLQRQFLQASDATYYPHVYLFWQLLTDELQAATKDWRAVWDARLQREMQRGKRASYQICFTLRLLLWKDNKQQQQAIANALLDDLNIPDQRKIHAIYIINIIYMIDMIDMIDMRDVRYMRDMIYMIDMIDVRYMRDMRDMINKDQVIAAFCNNLGQGRGNTTQVLFALYNVASSYTKVLETMERQIQQCFSVLAPQATLEQRLLITAIQRRIGIEALPHYATPPTHSTPDQRACALDALKQRSILKLADVQELFAACTDARDLSTATVKQLLNSEFSYNVGEISWKLLSQSWDMMPEAWTFVVDALGEQNPLICGVATLLLQRGKNIPQGEREKAKASIRAILADEQLARRPLDAPGGEIMRLDDVLFEALRALAE